MRAMRDERETRDEGSGQKFEVFGTSNPEFRVAPVSLFSPVSSGYLLEEGIHADKEEDQDNNKERV